MSERFFVRSALLFRGAGRLENKPRKQTKAERLIHIIQKSRPSAKSVSPDPPVVHPACSFPRTPHRVRTKQVITPVAMFQSAEIVR